MLNLKLNDQDICLIHARIARGGVILGILPRDMNSQEQYRKEFESQKSERFREKENRNIYNSVQVL